MSQSTDAILAFGVDFGDSLKFPWLDEESQWEGEFDKWWAFQNGVTPPEGEYETHKEDYPPYWAKCRELEEKCPVEVISHCSGDYPMYILAIRGTKITARRGYPEKASTKEVNPEPIVEFCKKYELEMPEKPSWLLFSNWS